MTNKAVEIIQFIFQNMYVFFLLRLRASSAPARAERKLFKLLINGHLQSTGIFKIKCEHAY